MHQMPVLVVDEQEGEQDMTIVELFSPVYDVNEKTLKYEVIPDNTTSIELPGEFGTSTLVIDHLNSGTWNRGLFNSGG